VAGPTKRYNGQDWLMEEPDEESRKKGASQRKERKEVKKGRIKLKRKPPKRTIDKTTQAKRNEKVNGITTRSGRKKETSKGN
jgi:hypothetical protein